MSQLGQEENLTRELLELCGDSGFLMLTEMYGGTRLFVPAGDIQTSLFHDLGGAIALKLANAYGGTYLRVPLARSWRARQYKSMGASHARIARALGMTETGVEKLFARMDRPPQKGQSDQLSLFTTHTFKTTTPRKRA
jgi:hypothetical protein